jgi:hypothetical protein
VTLKGEIVSGVRLQASGENAFCSIV